MNIDISHIDPATVGPNSIIVARVNLDELTPQDMQEAMSGFKALMKDRFDPSVRAFVIPASMELAAVPEEVMNQAGWYRLPSFDIKTSTT